MASRSLGTLTLDLIARIGGFEKGLDQAQRTLDAKLKAMGDRAEKAGRIIGSGLKLAAAGAAAAVAALAGLTIAAVNNADQLDELSQKLGIGADQLSKWGYAAKLSGTDLDGLGRGIAILSKNAAAALDPGSPMGKLFRDGLQIDVTDAEGNLKSIEQLLPEIADRFQRLDNQTLETALAMKVFGKSGTDLLEFLNRGGAGIQELGAELESLGGVISNDTAAAAAEFKDELDRLKQVGAGLGAQLAGQLLPVLKDLVLDLRGVIREGDLVQNIVTLISGAASAGVGAIDAYNQVVERTTALFEFASKAGAGFAEVLSNAANAWSDGSITEGLEKIRQARQEGVAAGDALDKKYSSVFRNVIGTSRTVSQTAAKEAKADAARLQALLAAGSGGSKGGKKAGKSDAEREAESLARAAQSMNERLAEQIALFGQTSEAARVRYEVELGGLQALDSATKATLIGKAEQLDQLREEKELRDAADDAVKREGEAYERNQENIQKLIADMEFELALLGMTNKEREREIALRYAGADATDAQRESIAELSDKLRAASKQDDQWRQFQYTLSDTFYDVAMKADTALESIKGFFDGIGQQITRSIADNWSEKIADIFKASTTSSGSSGAGFWTSLLGSLWGGGKASGGMALPGKLYEVNERGFEMATVGGRDYMLTGSRPVDITPNHQLSGGGIQQVNNFTVAGRIDRSTQGQLAQKVGREASRATRRNGG